MFTIRPATLEDTPALARVHVDTWRTTYVGIVPDKHLANLSYERSQALWQEHFHTQPDQQAYVVEVEPGQVVGLTSCGPIREPLGVIDGELYGLYILKAFQHIGLGKALVCQVVQNLAARGFHSMCLWCLKDNPACSFYERLGGFLTAEKTIEIGGKQLVDVAYAWPDLALVGVGHVG
jgi:ribosomal protein S18 acetylase RimI-like enzyme